MSLAGKQILCLKPQRRRTGTTRVLDAFGTSGSIPDLGQAELTALQDVGYNENSPAPEPAEVLTLSMIGQGLGGLLLHAHRQCCQEM